MTAFQQLGLDLPLLQAIEDLGFTTPSEVQEKAIPLLLERETDLVALAQTGTGKTAAFGFPMIQRIDPNSRTTQGLILSPTRELCLQITQELKHYSKYVKGLHTVAIYGGASIQEQAKSVKRGAQILVATPGRMKDMIGRGMVNINHIEYCVLDEADEMLNMGFYEDIKDILSHTPQDKLTWLFSATMPKEVAQIAKKFMSKPAEITVGAKNAGAVTVQHEYYKIGARDRYPALKRLADANPGIFSVIFCRTKRDTQKVAEKLIEDGYNAGALHGDLSQNQRDLVMTAFRKKQIQMLVATDVAARGIDVDDITHVIHYQLPDEIETYTHRSGRTGRAGKSGISMVLITRSEQKKISQIERIIGQSFQMRNIPNGMEICEIQLYHLANNIKNTEIQAESEPFLPAIFDVLEGLDREDLIRKLVSVEFSRFFNYYKKAGQWNESLSDNSEFQDHSEGRGKVRYFINVGERDGFDWMSLKDFIRKQTQLEKDDVFRVEPKDSFAFFNTEEKFKEIVLEAFENCTHKGRKVNVEVSSSGPRNRRGGSGGKKKGHRKGKGGFHHSKGGRPKNKKSKGNKKNKPKGFY